MTILEMTYKKISKKFRSEIDAIPSLAKVYPVLNDENIQASTSKTLQTRC